MRTILNVPHKVRRGGEIEVLQTPAEIRAAITEAKRRKQGMITLTDAATGQNFDLKHSLINTMERR
jgi:hypothetical protein